VNYHDPNQQRARTYLVFAGTLERDHLVPPGVGQTNTNRGRRSTELFLLGRKHAPRTVKIVEKYRFIDRLKHENE